MLVCVINRGHLCNSAELRVLLLNVEYEFGISPILPCSHIIVVSYAAFSIINKFEHILSHLGDER